MSLLLAQGEQNAPIAERLGLRPNTVVGVVKETYHRVGVDSRQALRGTLLAGRPAAL